MPALATYSLGTEPVGTSILHDSPVVTLTAPVGTLTTGGPTVDVTWTFSQPQGDVQEWWKVTFTDDAGTTVYYDSGWQQGAVESHVVDLDAEEVPVDSTDVTCHVYVRGPEAIGTGTVARYEDNNESAIVLEWGVPHCTITSPTNGQIITLATNLPVSWTFSDDRGGKTQGWYRVQLRYADSDLVVYDTGWVAGTDLNTTLPYLLTDGTSYEVVVQLKNNEGVRSD